MPDYGVGAVISPRYADGGECSVAYASQTLTPAEQNYAQVEEEALALVFGLNVFTSTCMNASSP